MHTTAVVIAHATDGVPVPEDIDLSMAWVCVCVMIINGLRPCR